MKSLLLCVLNSEGDQRALFRLRLQYELAADAAPLSIVPIRLRRPFSRLSVRYHPPLALAQLRHGQCISRRRQRGMGHSLRYQRFRTSLSWIASRMVTNAKSFRFIRLKAASRRSSTFWCTSRPSKHNVPRPNAEYRRLIIEGAKHWNLPASYLALLEAIQVDCD